MKKHDENKDLKSFSRIGKINYSNKTLRASKSAIIGIRLWGKIDFLTHYCGWHFIWDNNAGIGGYYDDDDEEKTEKVKTIIKMLNLIKKILSIDKTKKINKRK